MASLYLLPAWQNGRQVPSDKGAAHKETFYPLNRCGHTAVCVNEELIIWGGYSDDIEVVVYPYSNYCETNVLWAYNLDNDVWFKVETTGPAPDHRSGATSVLIWPHWYIIGGFTNMGNVNDVNTINLITLVWEKVKMSGALPCPRDKATAWTWANRIYLYGGFGSSPYANYLWDESEDKFIHDFNNHRGWIDQVVYLDTETMDWVRPTCKGQKPEARAAHTSTRVGSHVFVFGGRHRALRMNDLHRLDLDTHTWSGSLMCLGEIPCGRSWHTMTKMDEINLVLFGGFTADNTPLDDAWLLNSQTCSWSLVSAHTGFPRLWHTASFSSNGDTLVFGGCTTNIVDPETLMETSRKVVLLRTQPFALQRLCLHALFNHRTNTEQLWNMLPRSLYNWLCNRKKLHTEFSSVVCTNAVELGYGPSLSSLSVVSKEDLAGQNVDATTNGLGCLFATDSDSEFSDSEDDSS